MTVVVLTGTSASPQTWTVPKDAPPGTLLNIEAWGAGSGGSGGNASNRAGGGAGSWAKTFYLVTAADATSGITYTLQAGGAGSASANSTVGPDTTFGPTAKNLIPCNNNYNAVVGGSLPLNWFNITPGGLTLTVAGLGTDTGTGLPYIDLTFAGTTNNTFFDVEFTHNGDSFNGVPATAALNYNFSAYLSATNTTNTTACNVQVNYSSANGTFLSNANYLGPTLTTTLTQYSGHLAAVTSAVLQNVYIRFSCSSGVAINFTLRLAGLQLEQNTVATTVQLTPTSYTLARGGGATAGTTGGLGLIASQSFGALVFSGGNGATKTQGGGGGGSGGKDGTGGSSSSATGATGDNGSGGAAGVSNVEGGGGATASATPGAAGAPGGGGGANSSTGSGSAGARGQVRITYTPTSYGPQVKPWRQRHMLIR